MASSPSWEQSPDAWDSVTLGGLLLPGVCQVRVKPNRRIDKKQASGSKGAAIVDKGPGLAKVDIRWCFTASEWDAVQVAAAAIFPYKNTPQPLDIIHPITVLWGIKSIFIEDIEADDPDDHGLCDWKIAAYEYAKPAVTKVTKVDKSASTTGQNGVGSQYAQSTATGDTLTDLRSALARNRAARALPAPLPVAAPAPQRATAPTVSETYVAPPRQGARLCPSFPLGV